MLDSGIRDLKVIAQGVEKVLGEETKYLEELIELGKVHRFAGSVNAKYYGAKRIQINERKLAALAATVYACLNALTETAPLKESPALRRMAN